MRTYIGIKAILKSHQSSYDHSYDLERKLWRISGSKIKQEFKNEFGPMVNFATNKNKQIFNADVYIRLVAISESKVLVCWHSI